MNGYFALLTFLATCLPFWVFSCSKATVGIFWEMRATEGVNWVRLGWECGASSEKVTAARATVTPDQPGGFQTVANC